MENIADVINDKRKKNVGIGCQVGAWEVVPFCGAPRGTANLERGLVSAKLNELEQENPGYLGSGEGIGPDAEALARVVELVSELFRDLPRDGLVAV